MPNKKNTVMRDFLDEHPISLSRCLELSKVNRTTFYRWLRGDTYPPAAIIDLLRMHAKGEPPSMHSEWHGWCFTQGKLWTPANRGFEPHEIAQIPDFYRDRALLRNIQKNFTIQSKFNF